MSEVKQIVEQKIVQERVKKIAQLIGNNDAYWESLSLSPNALPEEILALRNVVYLPNVKLLLEEAHRLFQCALPNSPLIPIYQLILELNTSLVLEKGLSDFQVIIDKFYTNKVINLVLGYDEYWIELNNKKDLSAELLALKKIASENNPERLTQLATKARTLVGNAAPYLEPLINVLNMAPQRTLKFEGALLKLERKITFFYAVKSQNRNLEIAAKTGDKILAARTQYQLAVLHNKHDNALRAVGLNYLEQAIAGVDLEIRAYALKERAIFRDRGEEQTDALNDLKQACEIFQQLKVFKEEQSTQERARTYLYYAEALMAHKEPEAALKFLKLAQALRPGNPRTIRALLQVQSSLKKYQNHLECIRDVNFDPQSLSAVDSFLRDSGQQSLWLEATQWGSIGLLNYLAPYINKMVLDQEGNNALHIAAREGHSDLLPILTRYLDLSAENKKGLTPILVASMHGRVNLVLSLLNDFLVKPLNKKEDLLSIAIAHRQSCVLDALVRDKGRYEAMLLEIGQLYTDVTKNPDKTLLRSAAVGQLYKRALETDLQLCKENPALGKAPMTVWMVKHHPEGMFILYQGMTPLQLAVRLKFSEGVYLLVEEGSELDNIFIIDQDPVGIMIANHLKNAVEKRTRAPMDIKQRREGFIDAQLANILKQLPKERVGLNNAKSNAIFKKTVSTILEKPVHSHLFQDEVIKTLDPLASLIVQTVLEKIQSGELLEGGLLQYFTELKFSDTRLAQVFEQILHSPWHTPTKNVPVVVEPSPSAKDSKENKEIKEKLDSVELISPHAEVFCQRFERQLDEAYGYFAAVVSGDVPLEDADDKQQKSMINKVAGQLPDIAIPMTNVNIPTRSFVSGAMALFSYLRQHYKRKQAKRMVDLFSAVTPYERTHFIRYTAERLAYKYHEQIHHMTPGSEGIERFADCAAARVVEYITSEDEHSVISKPGLFSNAIRVIRSWALSQEIPPEQAKQKTLYNTFLDGIIRVTSHFARDNERLQTINNGTLIDNWSAKAIFENTGVIIPETGERYAHPNVDVQLYGYCRGTKEEALGRGLTLGPDPAKGQFWGPGRVWDTAQGFVPLVSSSSRVLPPVPVLPAYQAQAAKLDEKSAQDEKHAKSESKSPDTSLK
jgi:hypothetical protein